MARVMIVDDALFMRASVKKILESNGHTVAGEASNGKEAIEKYVEVKPDIVTLDITMPEMDGIEALKRIKLIDPNAKILICSALGQKDKVIEAIQNGATGFVVKPFQEENFLGALDKALNT